ncbi:MAG TPA: thiolase domain-containing protein [Acidimicrobiales bacterium]|nr:thiolase domain-containing protein [Acidimicrobiales bacterium]
MRDVAIVSFGQSKHVRAQTNANEVEMLMPVVRGVLDDVGIGMDRVGFTCSGSTDYLSGQAFSFVMTLDAVGPWPPISESHVEMDGAWAMYEAWVKLQMGDIDVALIYAYSKSSPGNLPEVLTRQLDPYSVAPLWPDSIALAGLQTRALLDSGRAKESDLAHVAARSRRDALANPYALLARDDDADALLSEPYLAEPMHKWDCPPITDGAAAMVIAADDAARELCARPAWIRGIDHRVEPQGFGLRDLTRSVSTATAAQKAGVANAPVDLAEIHAPFTAQELILRDAIGLGDGVTINPSGGALSANPMMAAGLIRLGEAATRISQGAANRAVAHATSGPLLQQNLVCVLEGE